MNGFISYAHEDWQLVKTFRQHLRAVERAFGIAFWCDERMNLGDHWSKEIRYSVATATTG